MVPSTPYFRIRLQGGCLLGVVSVSTGTVYYSLRDLMVLLGQLNVGPERVLTVADVLPVETGPVRRQIRVIQGACLGEILRGSEPDVFRRRLRSFFCYGTMVKRGEAYGIVDLDACEPDVPEAVPVTQWIRKFARKVKNPYA